MELDDFKAAWQLLDARLAKQGALQFELLREQKPDGSWSNSDNTFWEGDPALVTAYSLLTLGMMQ